MSFFQDRLMPLIWGYPEGELAGLMLGDTPLFFDCTAIWCSYVVLP